MNPVLVLGADGYFDLRFLQAGATLIFEVLIADLTQWPDLDARMRWEERRRQPTLLNLSLCMGHDTA